MALTKVSNPVLTGTGEVGLPLTCSDGVWSSTPDSYVYWWYKDMILMTGVTGNTYTPVAGDIGSSILCDVRATQGSVTITAASNSITVIAAGTGGGTTPAVDLTEVINAINSLASTQSNTASAISSLKSQLTADSANLINAIDRQSDILDQRLTTLNELESERNVLDNTRNLLLQEVINRMSTQNEILSDIRDDIHRLRERGDDEHLGIVTRGLEIPDWGVHNRALLRKSLTPGSGIEDFQKAMQEEESDSLFKF